MNKRKIGYLRVSTQEQCLDRQILGLQGICDELHVEKLSAVARKRPVYQHVLKRLRTGDSLVVWDLDRAFRSTVDAITEAERLQERGIDFQIVNLQVDTATPTGRLLYVVMSAFAEFERNTLSQRTREGLAAARLRGQRLGRPPKLTSDDIRRARVRVEQRREPLRVVSADFDVSITTLHRALKRHCLPS